MWKRVLNIGIFKRTWFLPDTSTLRARRRRQSYWKQGISSGTRDGKTVPAPHPSVLPFPLTLVLSFLETSFLTAKRNSHLLQTCHATRGPRRHQLITSRHRNTPCHRSHITLIWELTIHAKKIQSPCFQSIAVFNVSFFFLNRLNWFNHSSRSKSIDSITIMKTNRINLQSASVVNQRNLFN